MREAAFWGLVTASSLWVGAALALLRLGNRWIGLAMAFGAVARPACSPRSASR